MKLCKADNSYRKEMKAFVLKNAGFVGSFGRVTIVIEPTCRDKAIISWAICSAGEKFRRRTGEFVALERLALGCHLPIEINNGWTLEEIAKIFAETVPMF